MKKKKIPWPAPGTHEAKDKGCTCPQEDNKYGVGMEAGGLGASFLIRTDCPLHNKVIPKDKV